MRDRDSRERGRRDRRAHARNDFKCDACRGQRERFLATATEYERVATLETHDAPPTSRGADHQPVDRLLAHSGTARALADEHALRGWCELERVRIDERIVEDDLGLGETRRRLARQEIEITWS